MTEFETIVGYSPGIIGKITALHAEYYAVHWGFGKYFEAKVAAEMAAFISGYDDAKDRVWSILQDGRIVGGITIDGTSEKAGIAHLRWFIVSDSLRGKGGGNHLMRQAVAFCDNVGYEKVYLWTFKGLDPARRLYEKYGFKLIEARVGKQWGTVVTEQRFERLKA